MSRAAFAGSGAGSGAGRGTGGGAGRGTTHVNTHSVVALRNFGTHMDAFWYSYGHIMALIWTHFGTHMDTLWYSYGHILALIWTHVSWTHGRIVAGNNRKIQNCIG